MEKFWWLLLLAILCAANAEKIDALLKRGIPEEKTRRKTCLAMSGAFVLVIVWILASALNPQARVERFVEKHGERLEKAILSGEALPDLPGVKDIADWPGEDHSATEFYLFGAYCGCYYSPDDVPLPFQNVPIELSPAGKDTWTWTGEGDNHGMTRKIKENWYSYQASF